MGIKLIELRITLNMIIDFRNLLLLFFKKRKNNSKSIKFYSTEIFLG